MITSIHTACRLHETRHEFLLQQADSQIGNRRSIYCSEPGTNQPDLGDGNGGAEAMDAEDETETL